MVGVRHLDIRTSAHSPKIVLNIHKVKVKHIHCAHSSTLTLKTDFLEKRGEILLQSKSSVAQICP